MIAAITVFLLVGAGFAHVAVGFPGSWEPDRYQTVPDAVGDWVTTRAAVDGVDPYLPIDELASRYGIPVDDLPSTAVHPRLPGALLLQLPLLLSPWRTVVSWMTIANLFALALVGWWGWRWRGEALVALGLPFLVLSPLFLELVGHAGYVGPMVVLLSGSWWLASRRIEWAAGLLVGALASLRAFPLLLLPAFWIAGRRRTAVWGSALFVLLNLAGMGVFDLGAADVTSGLTAGAGLFGTDAHNASLAGLLNHVGVPYPVGALVGLAVSLSWWAHAVAGRHGQLDDVLSVTVPAMLLASPLSWPSYHLFYLPVLARWLSGDRSKRAKVCVALTGLAYTVWHLAGVAVSGAVSAIANVSFVGASSISDVDSPAAGGSDGGPGTPS